MSPRGGAGGQGSRGSGAALGEKVLRLSSIHTGGLLASHSLTLIGAIVVAVFLGPAEFGRYGLLLFAASLLSFLFNLGSKQGTLKRVFGGGDEDDDDEDEEGDDLAESRQRALGTGLVLTALVAILGTALVVFFAEPVSEFLLGEATGRELIVWAGLAGGFGSILRLGSLAIWMEHRPRPYVFIECLRPTLALAIAVPLLAGGAGVVAAISAYAIGSAVAALVTVILLGRSVELCFEPKEALTIMRRGAKRVPVVSSMWTVNYMDLFLLSRFVSEADLGIYHLASQAGFAVAFLPAGYRKALRPLRKTPAFHAVEDEYGAGVARGMQLSYFLLMLAGVLLAVSLAAKLLARIAPEGYGDAAALIPLLSAGLVAPSVYRMISKSTKFGNKSIYFIGGAVSAALLFIGISLLLIPELGIWAPPIAMLAAFALPSTALLVRDQRTKGPMQVPGRSFVASFGSAVLIAAAYYLIDPGPVVLELLFALGGLGLWIALLPFSGAIPRYHRGPIIELAKASLGRRRERFDVEGVIDSLPKRERRAVKLAVVRRRPLERVADKLDRDEDDVAEQLVWTLRRFAADGDMQSAKRTRRDAAIGRFLFAREIAADRNAYGRELMTSGGVDSGDLRELEAILEELWRTPVDVWSKGKGRNRG